MQNYMIPEGFYLDQGSGLYYKVDEVTDELGNKVQWVTWFNDETGEYTQYSYPVEPESISEPEPIPVPVAQYVAPEGYFLDEASGLYYQVNDYQGQDGKSYQQVIWFNSITGEYTQANYESPSAEGVSAEETFVSDSQMTDEPQNKKSKKWIIWLVLLLIATGVAIWYFKPYEQWMKDKKKTENTTNVTKKTNVDCKLTVEPTEDHSAIIRLTVPNLMYSYDSFIEEEKESIMTYRWAVEFDQYAVAVTHFNQEKTKGKMYSIKEMQNSIWEIHENESRTIGDLNAMKLDGKTFVWSIHMEDMDFSKLKNYTVDIKIPGFSYHKTFKASQVITGKSTTKTETQNVKSVTKSTPFPHANLYYMLADSDDQFIYTIHQRDPHWKFQMEGARGDIYRVNKDGSYDGMEKIINFNESISAIAVEGNYIYYATSLMKSENGQDRYGFFRVPKKGGSAEFLFENEFSYIRAYDGKLYFVFPEQSLIGILNPKDRSIDYKAIDVTQIADIMSGGSKSNFHCFTPFSVYDGKLYFGGYFEQTCFYNSYDLNSGGLASIRKDSFDMLSETDEGRVMIYGLNPIFIENQSLINPDANGFLAITDHYFSCYKDSNLNKYAAFQLNPNDATSSFKDITNISITSSGDAYGVVGDWILFPDQLLLMKDQAVKKTISPDRVRDLSNYWNVEEALKEHM